MKAEKKNKACSNIVVTLTMFPLKSMLGNFLLMYLMAGSMLLSARKDGRVFGSVHVCNRGDDEEEAIGLTWGFWQLNPGFLTYFHALPLLCEIL